METTIRRQSSPGCTRREFIAGVSATALTALAPQVFAGTSNSARPNVILITADDMDYASLGVTGSKTPEISPNLDALAARGIIFERAHVTSAICQPSRSAIMTGRYPHRSGALGFDPINADVPTLTKSLRSAGYLNGILAKVGHLQPIPKFCWDSVTSGGELGTGRSPALYYERAKSFFEQARSAGKPFFLMANSQDPHRPFPVPEEKDGAGAPAPSRYYKPDEVALPGFLPQGIADIRTEVAYYYSAVRRLDDTVGQLLRALKESGQEDNTLILFLSDNGMAFPFAKTNCYKASTRTPLIAVWPGRIKPGTVNPDDLLGGIDIMPTILEALAVDPPKGMDGRSFLPLAEGRIQGGREAVFTFITRTSARNEYPMRSVRTKRFSYIFNAWADGKTVFKNESQSGLTFKAMQAAAESDPKIAERVKLFQYRVPEEYYDLQADPCEMTNLIDSADHKSSIEALRRRLLAMMESSGDPLTEAFRKRVGGT